METLPNYILQVFTANLAIPTRKNIYMVKPARSRQTCEVTTRDFSDQQFLSHDLGKHVAANLLDKDLKSRHRIKVTTRSDTGAKRKLLRQETGCKIEKKIERRILSRHRSGCREAERRQLLS